MFELFLVLAMMFGVPTAVMILLGIEVGMAAVASAIAGAVGDLFARLTTSTACTRASKQDSPRSAQDKQGFDTGTKGAGRDRAAVRVWARKIRSASLIFIGLTLSVLLCLNIFFLEPTLRWVFQQVEKKTGVAVSFESASGNLFTGRVELGSVSLIRDASDTSEFNIEVDEAALNLGIWSLFGESATLDELRLNGVSGEFARLRDPDSSEIKRILTIAHCVLEDVNIDVSDTVRSGDSVLTALRIERLEGRELRSNWAIHDFLFRTNSNGTLDGHVFSVDSEQMEDEWEVRWRVESFPVAKAAAYLGKPLTWIEEGRLDVDITNRWEDGESQHIDMRWELVLHDIQARTPAGVGRVKRKIAKPIVDFLNKHSRRLPVEFALSFDANRFAGAYSAETVGFWLACSKAMANAIATIAGVDRQELSDRGKDAVSRLKGYMKNRH